MAEFIEDRGRVEGSVEALGTGVRQQWWLSSVVQSLSHVQLLATPWTATLQAPLSSTSSCRGSVSHSAVSDSAIPWTVVCQAPLPVRFSRQEH